MWEQSFLEAFSEFSLWGPRLRWLRVLEREREPEVARGHTQPEPRLGKHLQYFAELMSQNDSHSDTDDGAVLFVLEKL